MATRARLTAQDLWRLGEGDVRRELVDGEIVGTLPAGGVQRQVTGLVGRRLAGHVEAHGDGEVVVGDVGFVLNLPYDAERARAPDVAFVTTGRLPAGRVPRGFLTGPPDLAVEVLSPSYTNRLAGVLGALRVEPAMLASPMAAVSNREGSSRQAKGTDDLLAPRPGGRYRDHAD